MRLGKFLSSLTKPELENIKELLNLTEDEELVLKQLIKGHNVSRISIECNMSERTVERKIEKINLKLGKIKEGYCLKKDVPISEKYNLTLEEAAAYFNIGTDKIREITEEHKTDLVLMVGVKRLIKKKKMEEFLDRLFVL